MFFNISALFFFFVAISIFESNNVVAAPISKVDARDKLIVFNPHIIAPVASVAWAKGSVQTVKWDTTEIPPQHTHNTGVLLLGFTDGKSDSENLDIDHPLASGFSLGAGEVDVTTPTDVPDGDNYFLVLFGDSGNRSPSFRIN